MQKVKIEKIVHFEKDKDNNPLVIKTGKHAGKPYTRCIITDDKGTLSGFGDDRTKTWKIGDEVELIVTINGQWRNFKSPPQTVQREEFEMLKHDIKFCKDEIGYLHKKFEGLDLKNKVEEIEGESSGSGIDLGDLPPDEPSAGEAI